MIPLPNLADKRGCKTTLLDLFPNSPLVVLLL